MYEVHQQYVLHCAESLVIYHCGRSFLEQAVFTPGTVILVSFRHQKPQSILVALTTLVSQHLSLPELSFDPVSLAALAEFA